MRKRIIDALGPATHRRFLVYLMGPYKAFDLAAMVPDHVDPTDLSNPFDDWDDATSEYTEADVLALLERTRDSLRDEAGLNAFLAIDVGIDLDELDAATQTIEFARASNAIVFVAPRVGKNLGVGIEVGSVLEALDAEDRERVVFVHEEGVRSAMIAALSRRWDAAVYSYADDEELVKRLREFSLDTMNRELTGDLPPRTDD